MRCEVTQVNCPDFHKVKERKLAVTCIPLQVVLSLDIWAVLSFPATGKLLQLLLVVLFQSEKENRWAHEKMLQRLEKGRERKKKREEKEQLVMQLSQSLCGGLRRQRHARKSRRREK